MTDPSTVPTWPRIEARTRTDGSGELTINGTSYPIETTNAEAARAEIIRRVVDTATKIHRPVRVATTGPDGNWPIIVHPDGAIEADPTKPAGTPDTRTKPAGARRDAPAVSRARAPEPTPTFTDRLDANPTGPIPQEPALPPNDHRLSPINTTRAVPPPPPVTQDVSYSTEDLLHQLRPTTAGTRAQTGWRSWLGLKPSAREQAVERDLIDVRTQFPRAVTVVVANPKGGGGKTPTSLVIAGEMGHARGGGVVVWDNNELRGNARDRSYFPHTRSVADLLDEADRLERPDAAFTELAYYLAHQTHGKYYVLSSDQSGRIVMDQDQVKRVHRILARFFEVIIIDTGNNEKAPNWLAARDLADCLVVPMKWRQDSILVANRMLATMAEERNPLLHRALIVGSNGPGDSQREARRAVLSRFGPNHPITEIKTDPHIHAGAVIDRRQLSPQTQRAGLQAAAIVGRLCRDPAGA